MSLELGWMPPGAAAAFVGRALDSGLLHEDGELVRLAIDPSHVEIPRGFRPDPEAVPTAQTEGDPFVVWLHRVAKAKGVDVEQVLGLVTARQDAFGGLLTAQAAVLGVAAQAGLDVRKGATEALQAMGAIATIGPE